MAKLFSVIMITVDTDNETGQFTGGSVSGRVVTNAQVKGAKESWHENTFEANNYEEAKKLFSRIEEIFNSHAAFHGDTFGV